MGFDVQERQLLAGMKPGRGARPREGARQGTNRRPPPATGVTIRWRRRATTGQPDRRRRVAVPNGDYRQFYLWLRAALDGAGGVPVTPAQATAVMAVVLAARDAAHTGSAQMLPLSAAERAAFDRDTPIAR